MRHREVNYVPDGHAETGEQTGIGVSLPNQHLPWDAMKQKNFKHPQRDHLHTQILINPSKMFFTGDSETLRRDSSSRHFSS